MVVRDLRVDSYSPCTAVVEPASRGDRLIRPRLIITARLIQRSHDNRHLVFTTAVPLGQPHARIATSMLGVLERLISEPVIRSYNGVVRHGCVRFHRVITDEECLHGSA